MTTSFGETLRRLRTEKGLSQQQLAVRLHMERPSVANWEAGRRMPDAATVYQIAEALSVDSSALLSAADDSGEAPNVLLVDDEPLIVTGGIPVLQEAMPNANVVGLTKPSQALAFSAKTRWPSLFWTSSWAEPAALSCAGSCCGSGRAPT